jgi:hypothetical protein
MVHHQTQSRRYTSASGTATKQPKTEKRRKIFRLEACICPKYDIV